MSDANQVCTLGQATSWTLYNNDSNVPDCNVRPVSKAALRVVASQGQGSTDLPAPALTFKDGVKTESDCENMCMNKWTFPQSHGLRLAQFDGQVCNCYATHDVEPTNLCTQADPNTNGLLLYDSSESQASLGPCPVPPPPFSNSHVGLPTFSHDGQGISVGTAQSSDECRKNCQDDAGAAFNSDTKLCVCMKAK